MKEPRIHYHNASFGTPTPCGITPSYRRPTKTVRNWLQVDCAECLASTRSSQIHTAPHPSRIIFPTGHPRWPETLAAVKTFMDRFGRERAKALIKKYVRPHGANIRVSNIPAYAWRNMRSEIEYWLALPDPNAIREAAWGDLYFWRRDRPNRSWHWLPGRETSQSKFHGQTADMQGDKLVFPHARLSFGSFKAFTPCPSKFSSDVEQARVLEGILNFNYKEMEARVNAASKYALLYGSAGYTIATEDLKQPPTVKENAVSLQNLQNLSKNFGFNPAEFVPARHGQPWDYESDSRLIRFLKGGFSVAEIAAELQRSEVSIECRITFLAYKDERAALLQAGIAKLTAEPKAPRKAAKRKKAKGRK